MYGLFTTHEVEMAGNWPSSFGKKMKKANI